MTFGVHLLIHKKLKLYPKNINYQQAQEFFIKYCTGKINEAELKLLGEYYTKQNIMIIEKPSIKSILDQNQNKTGSE